MSRHEASAHARELVRNLDFVARERRLAMLDGPRGSLSLPFVTKAGLVQAIASALEGDQRNATFALRDEGYRLAEIVRNLRERALRRDESAPVDVLFVPRTEPHMRDLLRVAPLVATQYGARVAWATFRAQDAVRARALGHRVFNAAAMGLDAAGVQLVLRMHIRSVVDEVRERAAELGPGLDAGEAFLQRNAAYATQRYAALKRVMDLAHPRVVVVGNAALLEGRIAAHLAKKHAASTLMLQHGDIVAGKEHFADLAVDRYCVWGERSKDLLVQSEVDASQISVVGAPWLDARAAVRAASALSKPTILVALSGAGHMVGRAEHDAVVNGLFSAVAELPGVHWIFRIHPKDDAAPYRTLAREHGQGRVEVVEARASSLTIQDQLRDASLLITIMSTSAIDAMLARVPVVTFARAHGEHVPDYVEKEATTSVTLTTLVPSLRRLLKEGQAAHVTDNAQRFAQSFYGPLDGGAADRVAADIALFLRG